MTTVTRLATRFVTGRAPHESYLADELSGVFSTIKAVRDHIKALSKARALIRPVAECLQSKPLAAIYGNLNEAVEQAPALIRHLETIVVGLTSLDDQLVAEERRQTALAAASTGEYELDLDQVKIPETLTRTLKTQFSLYDKLVETTFDKSLSIDEIGDAGSAQLRAYARLLEKLDGWEELNLPEIDIDPDGLADRLADRVLESMD